MGYTLYSFKACPHYCCASNPTSTFEILDHFDTIAAVSADCLGRDEVDRHISSPSSCPRCQKEPSEILTSIDATRKEINVLKDLVESILTVYDILVLAHEQFALNDMNLAEDQFMTDIWHAIRLTTEAEDELFSDPDELTNEKLESIFEGLNQARISYSLFCTKVFELKTSVEMVSLLGGPVSKKSRSDEAGDDGTIPSRAVMTSRILRQRWNRRVNAAFE